MQLKPDLLVFADGTAVGAQDWERRRAELYDAIVPTEYGGMPPKGEKTTAIRRSSNTVRDWGGVNFSVYEVRTVFADGQEISFTLSLWRPLGDGPFPVVLCGDGCWRYFDDSIVQQVVQRGNIAAVFDRTELAADNKGQYRDTGLYRLFPAAGFGALAPWAWGYHRAVDVLERMPEVRGDAIAATGHSRGGKAVLLAGATDKRIAITNPNDSGTGGAGPNRLKATGAEMVEDFFGSGNIFWFGADFAAYRGRDREMPYEQHMLHGLVAPRGLLVTEAYEDKAANPAGAYAACLAALPAYKMLGGLDRIGWSVREGGHSHAPADFAALLDFVDLHLHGRQVRRDFQRPLFPGLKDLLE
jgi:hypothetical protein